LSNPAYRETVVSVLPSGTAVLGVDYEILNGIKTPFGDAITMVDSISFPYVQYPNDSIGSNISTVWSVDVDDDGNIYVSDHGDAVIKYVPGDSIGIVVAGGNGQGTASNQLYRPRGIVLDAIGNLYVAERGNDRVTKWSPGFNIGVVVAGGNGNGSALNQLGSPSDVFVDNQGNVYVSEWDNHRVTKWAPDASEGIIVAGNIEIIGLETNNQLGAALGGLFVDDLGNVYVSDTRNHRIQKWTPNASEGITIAGGNGMGFGPNQLNWPYEFAFGPDGNLYINDRFNSRIQVWEPGSTEGYTLLGGSEGTGVNELAFPVSITFGPNGDLYIGDTGNNRVQQVVLSDGGVNIPKGSSEGQIEVFVYQNDSLFESKSIVLTGSLNQGGFMSSQNEVTINITYEDNITTNQAPTIITATFNTAENSANGTVLGTLEASDPDGDTLTYTIVSGNDAEAFSLDSESGQLTVSTSSALDFETIPTFNLGIEVSDGALSDSAMVTINLTDVEEGEETLSLADASEMIYPNPTDGIINIKMADFKEATVYNLSGKRIMRSSDNRIDVSALSEGVYIIKLENRSGDRFSTRLIKE